MNSKKNSTDYVLENQIGHIIRKVNQRHTGIFTALMPDGVTPTRFSALVKLNEHGLLSQNKLGRLTAMDIATIKGVVDRLKRRELIQSTKDDNDARRQLISLTPKGQELIRKIIPLAAEITQQTTAPLTQSEAVVLIKLLRKLC